MIFDFQKKKSFIFVKILKKLLAEIFSMIKNCLDLFIIETHKYNSKMNRNMLNVRNQNTYYRPPAYGRFQDALTMRMRISRYGLCEGEELLVCLLFLFSSKLCQ